MHILSKILLAFLPDDLESIFKFALLFIVVPALLIALLFAGPITAAEKIPLINTEQVKMYIYTANKVSDSTKNKYSQRIQIDWRQLVAIDAVRFQQDFSKANPAEIENLLRCLLKK